MNEFAIKAIKNKLDKIHPEIQSIVMGKRNRQDNKKEIILHLQYNGFNLYIGEEIKEFETEYIGKISQKIQLTIKQVQLAHEGLEHMGMLIEQIKWRLCFTAEKERVIQESCFKEYAMALEDETSGTWEALQALEILNPTQNSIEVVNGCFSKSTKNCQLHNTIREKLKKGNFSKKVRPRTIVARFLKFLNGKKPNVRPELRAYGGYY